MQCYSLTPDQLQAYLAQGYVLLGGPFAAAQSCADNCPGGSGSEGSGSEGSGSEGSGGGPTYLTLCCPFDGLPEKFEGTITDKTGDLVCLPDTLEFDYLGDLAWGTSEALCLGTACAASVTPTITFQCAGGTWLVSQAYFQASITCRSCDPFQLIIALSSSGSCTGTATLTITPVGGESDPNQCVPTCAGPGEVDLVATVTQGPACLAGTSFTMRFQSPWHWQSGAFLLCSMTENSNLTLDCSLPDGWVIGNGGIGGTACVGGNNIPPLTGTLSPFSLTFEIPLDASCGGGSATIVVTE